MMQVCSSILQKAAILCQNMDVPEILPKSYAASHFTSLTFSNPVIQENFQFYYSDLPPVSFQVILAFITAASSTELVPERFLRPRDFNHHPFTDVGVPASLKQTPRIPQTHPYAILAKKRPREGRQFPHQDVILYPSPHPSVLPKKHLETNEISNDIITNEVTNDVSHYDDPYVHVSKKNILF